MERDNTSVGGPVFRFYTCGINLMTFHFSSSHSCIMGGCGLLFCVFHPTPPFVFGIVIFQPLQFTIIHCYYILIGSTLPLHGFLDVTLP